MLSREVTEMTQMTDEDACEVDAAPWYNCHECGGMYRHGEAVNGCCSEECNDEAARRWASVKKTLELKKMATAERLRGLTLCEGEIERLTRLGLGAARRWSCRGWGRR